MLEGSTKEAREEREKVDQWWADRLGMPDLSPRWVLQQFGTNVCREHFHNDIWLATVENKLRKGIMPNVVISDSRFINELNLLKGLGGTMARVCRGPDPDWWEVATQVHVDPIAMKAMELSGIHRSEWDWAGFEFDMLLDNNGTLDDLYRLVDTQLLKNPR